MLQKLIFLPVRKFPTQRGFRSVRKSEPKFSCFYINVYKEKSKFLHNVQCSVSLCDLQDDGGRSLPFTTDTWRYKRDQDHPPPPPTSSPREVISPKTKTCILFLFKSYNEIRNRS
jgi:hypothetical protein